MIAGNCPANKISVQIPTGTHIRFIDIKSGIPVS